MVIPLAMSLLRNSLSSVKFNVFRGVPAVASFHTSPSHLVAREWKTKRYVPRDYNRDVRILEAPDYTFLDGRPTPVGPNKVRRVLQHQEYSRQILQFSQEMDFAVEREARQKREEEDKRTAILSRKLKPKGNKLG